ncbi:hypothetical protein GF351_01240 [Candidatus Woesearchaeota archaeon]|nr:hypothetical protein [Candidatus Woesearchaeota archaeon]
MDLKMEKTRINAKARKAGRKGQMEIMGLAIIVILMILGMLFVIRFVILAPEKDTQDEFTRTQLASNTLHAIVSTTTDCHKMTFQQLMTDCAEHKDFGETDCPGASGSCNYVYNELRLDILPAVLDSYGIVNYNLTAYLEDGEMLFPSIGKGDCGTVRKLQPQYYPTDRGTLFIDLMICQ